MKYKILSIFLVLCMCLTLTPVEVLNAETGTNDIFAEAEFSIVSENAPAAPFEEEQQEIVTGVPAQYATSLIFADDEQIAAQERVWEIINNYVDENYFLTDPYYSAERMEQQYSDELTDEQYEELRQEAVKITKDCTTTYEKIKAIVTYVADTVYYDYVYYNNKSQDTYTNPYDIFTYKRTVCSGYAGFVRTLCVAIGIPCMNLIGENHEYNAIYNADTDKWIFADATWCSWNTYNGEDKWAYNGYTLTRFDLKPEQIAELSSHEVYGINGIIDERNDSVYYSLGFEVGVENWKKLNGCAYVYEIRKEDVVLLGNVLGYDIDLESIYLSNKESIRSMDFSQVELTEVPGSFFSQCSNLVSVKLPSIVESIGDYAFYNCTALEEVDLKNTSLKEIDRYAFYGCENLKSINLPNTVEKVGDGVFYNCTALEEIDLSDVPLKELGSSVFFNCIAIEELDLSSSVITVIPDRMITCSDVEGKLKNFKAPATVTEIGEYAFYGLTALEELNFSQMQLTKIGQTAFVNSGLKRIILSGEEITELPSFSRCSSLEYVDISNTSIKTIPLYEFQRQTNLKEFKCPSTLEIIESGAFYECTSLEKMDLTETKVTELPFNAFYGCNKLKDIKFPRELERISDYAFSNCDFNELDLRNTKVSYIGYGAFMENPNLTTIYLPDTTNTIDFFAFYVDTQQPVKTVVYTSLLPADIVVNDGAWYGRNAIICEYLYNVVFDGNNADRGSMEMQTYGNNNTYTLPENLFEKDGYRFAGWNIEPDGSGTPYADRANVQNLASASGETVKLYAQWEKQTLSIEYANAILSETEFTYDGKAKEPKVTVRLNNTILTQKDYEVSYLNNVKVGVGYVIIKGKGNYTGTITKAFLIKEKTITNISNATVNLSNTSYYYDGKAKMPNVTVSLYGQELVKDIDYTVAYHNNADIGTATVIITGKGSYNGEIEKNFTITVKKNASYTVGAYKYKIINASTVAFAGLKNTKTTKVIVAKTVKIGGKTFKVTAIADKALSGKSKVTSVTIGENVATIGNEAFQNCKKLNTITIKSSKLKSVGENALKGMKSNARITVPAKKLTAYKKLLKGKGQGKKVKIIKK